MSNSNNLSESYCQTYSDLYKDLHGFRPDLARFRALSPEDQADEIDHLSSTLADAIAEECEDSVNNPEPDHFRDDVEADADVLRSAGMGTDEDYGLFEDGYELDW